jgi:hypothetical protein
VRIDTIPFSEGKALGAGGYNEDHEFDGYRVPI